VNRDRGEPVRVHALTMARQLDTLVVTGNDHRCRLLRYSSEIASEFDWPLTGDGYAVDISADGQMVACGGSFESTMIWNTQSHALRRKLTPGVHTLACRFSSSGDVIVTGHSDGSIRSWSVESGDMQQTIVAHRDHVTGLEFIDNERLLISIDKSGQIALSDMSTGEVYGALLAGRPEAGSYAVEPFLRWNSKTSELLAVRPAAPDTSELIRWTLPRSGFTEGESPQFGSSGD